MPGHPAPADLPIATRLTYWVAQGLAHLLLPVIAVLLLGRARREPGYLHHLSHRLGLGPRPAPGAIWVFAASLGETRTIIPLVQRLRAAGHAVVLTHQTPAGLAEGRRGLGTDAGVTHCYVPLDLFWTVRLFLSRVRPAALIVVEIEIWPAMLIETARRGVPLILANGNLLERSVARRKGLRRHLMALYSLFRVIFTRDARYRDRYVQIGVDPARIQVVGDLKYDQWIDPAQPPMGRALRSRWPGAARVLMIASSIEAEEPLLVPMVERLLAGDPGLRVLWVPRSPQRFGAMVQTLTARGLSVARRSDLGAGMAGPMPAVQVLVGDSLGEMNAYYPMADLVFVGASLVNMGGHNLIEPTALGLPVVMGPSIYGIRHSADHAARAGAFESLPDAAALEARIRELLADADALARMSGAAGGLANYGAGSSDRTLEGIKALLTATAFRESGTA